MDLQGQLATHCGPVLFRKKPAALFTLPKADVAGEAFASILRVHALDAKVLCQRCANALVLVYDAAMLEACLRQDMIRRALGRLAYPPDASLCQLLDHLEVRVSRQADFPHEIGFFLGYPPEDVLGFMKHKGKRCKLCGQWKVYSDVPRAMAMFAEICQCRQRVLDHLAHGGSLYDLPVSLAG